MLENKILQITEDDIKSCTDHIQLKSWKKRIELCITDGPNSGYNAINNQMIEIINYQLSKLPWYKKLF